jgi:hypothetical protein
MTVFATILMVLWVSSMCSVGLDIYHARNAVG